jgi:DNA modification methylase
LENGRNPFYCENAAEIFLEKDSVDLFIGHPPYFQAELEGNGGDSTKQMQNVENIDEYFDRLLKCVKHMEHALKPNGHIFIALPNAHNGLGVLGKISNHTSLTLQTIRMWDYSSQFDKTGNHTAVFAHFSKGYWDPDESPQGPFVLTNRWDEAIAEVNGYKDVYAGIAPKGIYNEIITNYSKPGDVVCDLFAGAGTVCLVAMELGRRFIYNDVSEDRIPMAKKRIDDAYEVLIGQKELRS